MGRRPRRGAHAVRHLLGLRAPQRPVRGDPAGRVRPGWRRPRRGGVDLPAAPAGSATGLLDLACDADAGILYGGCDWQSPAAPRDRGPGDWNPVHDLGRGQRLHPPVVDRRVNAGGFRPRACTDPRRSASDDVSSRRTNADGNAAKTALPQTGSGRWMARTSAPLRRRRRLGALRGSFSGSGPSLATLSLLHSESRRREIRADVGHVPCSFVDPGASSTLGSKSRAPESVPKLRGTTACRLPNSNGLRRNP